MKPLKHRRLTEAIVDAIRAHVQERGLRPGDRLPSERELAEALGVSRASAREALRVLESQGYVRIVNGLGAFVHQPFESRILHCRVPAQDRQDALLQMLEVRRVLEGLAIELAARRATPDDLRAIGEALAAKQRRLAAGEDDSAEDQAFHHAIYAASHNEFLTALIESVSGLWREFWEYPMDQRAFSLSTASLHVDLYEALSAREPTRARAVFERFVSVMDDWVRGRCGASTGAAATP